MKKIFFITSVLILMPLVSMGQNLGYKNSVAAYYKHVFLEGKRSDWNLGLIWYKRKFTNVTSLFKIRYANRTDRSDYLVALDVYPVFSEKSYAHFNAGAALTQNELFPKFKASGTLFFNLTSSLIGGLGVDYRLYNVDDIFIYSVHLRWYVGGYLFLGQSLLQVRDKTPLGTGILTIRKYLTYPNYIYVTLAYGYAPQNLLYKQDVLNSFRSYLIAAGSIFELSDHFLLRSAINYRQSVYSSASTRSRFGISGGITYRF